MPAYSTDDIRNVALVGHGGSGKTTLTEALLVAAGKLGVAGEVTRGTTVSDFDQQEKDHQHSLASAIASFDHAGRHVNLVDCPGYPDFLGRALSVLPAVETAAVVVDARAGVQLVTRRMMEAAAGRGMSRLIVINRIDSDDVDLEGVLDAVVQAFGPECLPINLPAGGGQRVVDCFFSPEEGAAVDFSSVADAHTQLVDQVVEVDEALMELYLEQGEELEAERLHDAFEAALRDGHLIPVCFTSSATGAGVDKLLEILTRVMPSPREGNAPMLLDGEGDDASPLEVLADPDKPAIAHVFKVAVDNFVGKLGVFRVHQGTISKDSALIVGDARKPFRVGHLFKLQGKDHIEVDAAIPGDICAVAKIDDVHYNAVLHESHEGDAVHMAPVDLPAPMFGLAIETHSRGDEQKLSDALAKLSAEDPCFQVEHDTALNETIVRGLGDLHLRMVLEKMHDRYNVDVETRPPRIAYRETVRKPAEGHHRHKKQTGGAGQFGEVYLRIEPLERGAGFEFANAVVGGVIPHQLIPAVEKGVRQVLDGGAVAGYPLQDVKVTVYDGKFHPVDSKEVAFITAGKKAFIDAVARANPVVLEPVVDIHVTAPQESMGDITGDLSSKRGRISGTETLTGGMVTVSAQVPLSELSSYQSELKSATGGAGSYTMNLSHYDPVPSNIQHQLAAEFHPAADED